MYRGETAALTYDADAAVTSLTIYATNVETNPETGTGILYKLSKRYTRTPNTHTFTASLAIPELLALGRYEYQLISNIPRVGKSCCGNGTFTVLPNLANRQSNPEEQDTGYLSDAERKLRAIEKAIYDRALHARNSYTISGDSTQLMSVNLMYKERNRLWTVVNKERMAAGRPLLPGTEPAITYNTTIY